MSIPTDCPVTITIDGDYKARLNRLADARKLTPRGLIHEAIAWYVEREEKRESYRQDAVRAWEDFQSNGQHVTAQEADAWLEKLESGQTIEPPECHN